MFEGRAIENEADNNWTGTIGTGSVIYDAVDSAAKAACEAAKLELIAGTRRVFDCAKFTVNGQHLTSYEADVIDNGDFAKETNVIRTVNGITFFDESAKGMRSAPYFDIEIDGITKLNA